MISRLPPWVEYGAFALALVAGCVNAIAVLGLDHQALSHLSGTATSLGAGLGRLPWNQSLHLLLILVSFFFGALVSGLLAGGGALKLGRQYETLLVLEALLLFGAMGLFDHGSHSGQYLASAACGMQNALATTYSGAVVRTTHVTGLFTDLGILLGSWWRGEPFDRRKCVLFILIIVGFISGGVVGAWLFPRFSFNALAAPASACLLLAVVYHRYRVRQ
ncbi:YoaK family protein [Saccharospirillum mangrovi]|uniref:YoaK family protein n=1 Tax=Saccharospirillum mangrovi TaxID=2161747 RepID=UPI000D38C2B8|nr:YoaK family protein [Saccharospirillum mangrovi]